MNTNSKIDLSSILKDNLIVVFGVILLNVKGFILMPLIIKVAGAGLFGAYILINSLVSITAGVLTLGVGITAHRYLPSAKSIDERRKLFSPQFIFCFITSILCGLFLYLQTNLIQEILLNDEFVLMGSIFLAYLIGYFFYSQGIDYYRYTSQIFKMTFNQILFPYLSIGIIIFIFYYLELLSVNSIILCEAFSAGLVGLFCLFQIIRRIGFEFIFFKFSDLTKEIRLGFPLTLNVIVDFILSSSDRYLVGYFISLTAVGYYSSAYLVGGIILLIPKAIGLVLPQIMSKFVDNSDLKEAQTLNDYAIKIYLLLCIPFVFGCFLLSENILSLLTSPEVVKNTYLIAPIISIAMCFAGLFWVLTSVLFVQLRTKLIFKANLLASLSNFILNIIILTFVKSILVVAITTFFSYLIGFIYLNRSIKDWKINYDYLFIFKVLVCSCLMFIFLKLFMFSTLNIGMLIQTILCFLLSVPIYIVLILILKIFSKDERNFIKSSLI